MECTKSTWSINSSLILNFQGMLEKHESEICTFVFRFAPEYFIDFRLIYLRFCLEGNYYLGRVLPSGIFNRQRNFFVGGILKNSRIILRSLKIHLRKTMPE